MLRRRKTPLKRKKCLHSHSRRLNLRQGHIRKISSRRLAFFLLQPH